MEDGYLAKIIHGDGSKEIKVGEVMSLCYCTATQVHLCVCVCVCGTLEGYVRGSGKYIVVVELK